MVMNIANQMTLPPRFDGDTPARRRFLLAVNQRLDDLLRVDPDADDAQTECLIDAGRQLCLAGGKRARPWLVMMLGEALGATPAGMQDLAVCVELIHTASLLHDDVVDEGEHRRGKPTANVVWGNLRSVLAGDLVMTLSLGELRGHPPAVLHAAVDTVTAMSRAAVREAAARGRIDIGLARYRAIAEGKTGVLFALCGRGVGLLVDEPKAADRLAQAGLHMGVAFQIADDLDDLIGRAAGKDSFADLRHGNPSHPLLVAAETSPTIGRELDAAWKRERLDEAEVARLGRAVLELGAAERSWRAIGDEIEHIEELLNPWSDHDAVAQVCGWARGLWQKSAPLSSSSPRRRGSRKDQSNQHFSQEIADNREIPACAGMTCFSAQSFPRE
jgi:heptaprenyl diphosphate synthase